MNHTALALVAQVEAAVTGAHAASRAAAKAGRHMAASALKGRDTAARDAHMLADQHLRQAEVQRLLANQLAEQAIAHGAPAAVVSLALDGRRS